MLFQSEMGSFTTSPNKTPPGVTAQGQTTEKTINPKNTKPAKLKMPPMANNLVLSLTLFSAVCPCAVTPGGGLCGDTVEEPILDWNNTTANQENLCQLQIWAGIRPHSINLNCMATPEGELFLSCSVCDRKYWAARVGRDEEAVLRPVSYTHLTLPTNREV